MKTPVVILLFLINASLYKQSAAQVTGSRTDFFGYPVELPSGFTPAAYYSPLSANSVTDYIDKINTASLQPFVDVLTAYKKRANIDDWLYYQLVRKVAQYISPKAENYYRYTFFKWLLLVRSGYSARLAISGNYLLFYVQSDESIYNIPSRMFEGRQYVCLNYHDYGSIDFVKNKFTDVTPFVNTAATSFSYKVSQLPEFRQDDYLEKDIAFSDGLHQLSFRIKVNPQVKALFTNYPVVDYNLQFNMPISRPTYESLVPSLKKHLKGMKQKDGVEFLMRFTRYAFLFKPDTEVFGNEKRLSPEQTLLSDYSDCEDRAALFFFLVKELYNLPMLVLTFPEHVTVAVQFDKPYGKTIEYNGTRYSICEPSPQSSDLRIGQMLPELAKAAYQVAYAYHPASK